MDTSYQPLTQTELDYWASTVIEWGKSPNTRFCLYRLALYKRYINNHPDASEQVGRFLTVAKVCELQLNDPMADRVEGHVLRRICTFPGPAWTSRAASLIYILEQSHQHTIENPSRTASAGNARMEDLFVYFNTLMPISIAGRPIEKTFLARQKTRTCTCRDYANQFGRSTMIGSCMHSATTEVVFAAGQFSGLPSASSSTRDSGSVNSSIFGNGSIDNGSYFPPTTPSHTPFQFGYLKQSNRQPRRTSKSGARVEQAGTAGSANEGLGDSLDSPTTPTTPLGRWQQSIFSVADMDSSANVNIAGTAWDLDSIFDFAGAAAVYEV